jgi:hypothetical protein
MERLWSSNGPWYPSSRVQTRPKPSDFSGEKIHSMPSFRGVVKPSAPCCRFAACKRSLNGVENVSFRQNYWTPFSTTVPPFATRSARVVGTWWLLAMKVGTSKGRGQQWQTTLKNFPRMQRARAIPVAWLGSGSCQNRPKGWILIIIIIIIIIWTYI